MQKIKAAIPNLLTLGNAACGFACILVLMRQGVYYEMPWIIAGLMLLAFVFDFLDGFTARLLKVSSPIGKQLDSLADLVTFGIVPGLLMFRMMQWSWGQHFHLERLDAGLGYDPEHPVFRREEIYAAVAVLIPLLSALRLAKFNVDERQSDKFIGLPTPANALFILSLFLIFTQDIMFWKTDYIVFLNTPNQPVPEETGRNEFLYMAYNGPGHWVAFWRETPGLQWVLMGITVLFSWLLVSPVKLIALKFKRFGLKENWARYALLLLSAVGIALFSYKAVPGIIVLYFVLSAVDGVAGKKGQA